MYNRWEICRYEIHSTKNYHAYLLLLKQVKLILLKKKIVEGTTNYIAIHFLSILVILKNS